MPTETPLVASNFFSTDKNSIITCYDSLAHRILYQLGYPSIPVEIHRNVLYDNISQAVETFSKYIGYNEEYLIFNSALYQKGVGIRMDQLFSLTPEMRALHDYSYKNLSSSNDTNLSALSSTVGRDNSLSALTGCQCDSVSGNYSFGWDADASKGAGDYRRVISVFDFNEGSSNGINTLFTIEQSLAQQTYYNFALGNYGFDLISWHIVKEWMELREKVLALKVYVRFDPKTQLLRLIPEPSDASGYYGLIGCYVERPIKDMVGEKMVFKHALALTKIAVGRIRERYDGQTLLGGGQNAKGLVQEGLQELEKIEEEYKKQRGDTMPADFFIG